MSDKEAIGLDPKKLAAFYHAVGGDYDALFLKAPNESISYIWRALGVQHILQQPPEKYFVEPSIPALTFQGFVKWESIQILLEPQEHVPFIQFAVRNWGLKHPTTGELFPTNLPKECFPSKCDPDIDKWHKSCAERLRREAVTPEPPQPPPGRDPRVHAGFSHVHGPQVNPPRQRPEMDYFARERPNIYTRMPPNRHPGSHHSSPYSPEHHRMHSSSSEEPRRRRSFSDLKHSPEHNVRFSDRLDPRPPAPRRHSQPRHYSSPSTSSSDSESDADVRPRPPTTSRLYSHVTPTTPPPSIRRGPPPPPSVSAVPPLRTHRPVSPPIVDTRRRSLVGEVKHKITSLLPGSHDRHRSSSREHNGSGAPIRTRYTRENRPPLRRAPGWSDGSYPSPSDDSDSGVSPKQRDRHSHSHSGGSGRERERERERDRERDRERAVAARRRDFIDRERERDRERARDEEIRDRRNRSNTTGSSKGATYLRPAPDRRPSSHADAERRQRDREREYAWERERGRGSDYERGRAGGGSGRRLATSDERERDRRRAWKDRGPSPVVVTTTGVGGRRYPAGAAGAAGPGGAAGAGGPVGAEPPWN